MAIDDDLDLDDICGVEPTKKKSKKFEAHPIPELSKFWKPVTRDFLAQVFEMDIRTVNKRLAGLQPAAHSAGDSKRPLYDFKQAASRLIKPSFSLAQYVKSVRLVDLPPQLAPGIQQALLTRQTLETRARNLWRTEDVQAVLGEVFMILKDGLTLLPETIRDACPDLKDDHIERIRQVTDDIQNQTYERLCAMPMTRQTPSSLYDKEHVATGDFEVIDDEEDDV